MRFWKLFVVTVFLFAAVPSLADEGPSLNLQDRISVDEVNRALEERGEQTGEEKTFSFGFDLRAGPLEDARQYLPFLDYLDRSTGYGFKLRFTPKSSSIIEDLGTGKIDFAAIGAVSFIQALEKYGALSLARGVNNLGRIEYQSLIVVSPESPIRNLGELKGRRFAFGSVSSTQGYLIPRIVLMERGIALDDLAAYDFTGSYRNCANAVITGAFDACGMQDTMARFMAGEGLVRILHASRYYPSSGIAANKDIPPAVLEKVKRALLDFDPLGRDKGGLYNWRKTEMPNGFKAGAPSDYIVLRDWMDRLGRLDGTPASKRGNPEK